MSDNTPPQPIPDPDYGYIPRDFVPLDKYWLGWKTCPGCGERKRYNPENGGDFYLRYVERTRPYWETPGAEPILTKRLIRAPSGYCRECEKKRITRYRELKKALPVLEELDPEAARRVRARRKGRCDCCGMFVPDRIIVTEPRDAVICASCVALLDRCGGEVAVARDMWRSLVRHQADEDRLDRTWRSNRRRIPHQGNASVAEMRKAKLAIPDHTQCMVMQRAWKKVTLFLARAEQENVSTGE